MKAMNSLMKLSQMSQTMTAMAKEMEKAGLIEEMMDDVLDEDEDIDEDVEEEVNKVKHFHHTITLSHTIMISLFHLNCHFWSFFWCDCHL